MTRNRRWMEIAGVLLLVATVASAQAEAGQKKKKKGGGKKGKEPAAEKVGGEQAGGEAARGGNRAPDNPALAEIERRLLAYDTDEARRLIEERMQESDRGFFVARGRVLAQEKEYDRARSDLAAAADRSPDDPAPLLYLGETLLWAERKAEARDAFNRAETRARRILEGSPNDAVARFHLGVAQLRQERFDDAVTTLEKARAARPNDPLVLHHLGLARFAQERWGEAVDLFTAALDRDSGLAYAYYFRGLAANKVGRKDLMANDLDRFLFLAPDSPEAPYARRLLAAA